MFVASKNAYSQTRSPQGAKRADLFELLLSPIHTQDQDAVKDDAIHILVEVLSICQVCYDLVPKPVGTIKVSAEAV